MSRSRARIRRTHPYDNEQPLHVHVMPRPCDRFFHAAELNPARTQTNAVLLPLDQLALVLFHLLLRQLIGPVIGIQRPARRKTAWPALHRRTRQGLKCFAQALAGVWGVPNQRDVFRRGAMIEWMPICEQN
jgi:hypothetical protein